MCRMTSSGRASTLDGMSARASRQKKLVQGLVDGCFAAIN
jgi:hypothetical protein